MLMQLHYCYTYFTLWLLTVCWTVCVEELMPLGGNIDTELWGEEGSNYLFVYKTIDSIYCTVFYMAFLILVVWNSVLIMMHSVHGLILCTCISFTVEIYVIFQRSCTLYILRFYVRNCTVILFMNKHATVVKFVFYFYYVGCSKVIETTQIFSSLSDKYWWTFG